MSELLVNLRWRGIAGKSKEQQKGEIAAYGKDSPSSEGRPSQVLLELS
jgi:hypothetical protein